MPEGYREAGLELWKLTVPLEQERFRLPGK